MSYFLCVMKSFILFRSKYSNRVQELTFQIKCKELFDRNERWNVKKSLYCPNRNFNEYRFHHFSEGRSWISIYCNSRWMPISELFTFTDLIYPVIDAEFNQYICLSYYCGRDLFPSTGVFSNEVIWTTVSKLTADIEFNMRYSVVCSSARVFRSFIQNVSYWKFSSIYICVINWIIWNISNITDITDENYLLLFSTFDIYSLQ